VGDTKLINEAYVAGFTIWKEWFSREKRLIFRLKKQQSTQALTLSFGWSQAEESNINIKIATGEVGVSKHADYVTKSENVSRQKTTINGYALS